MTEVEKFHFQSEISQLMSLIINALYTNKEIFLRELISNASDALDKMRYESIIDPSKIDVNDQLYIRITQDKSNNTLTIEDNGIGMTREELINNLGVIARSGTKLFMESVKAGADISMIGQFGVGFYSAYLVAKNVVVVSRSYSSNETYIWESSADGTYSVRRADDNNEKLTRGTKVILFLKDDQVEYLEEKRVRDVVKKRSEFISFPIELRVEKSVEKEVSLSEDEDLVKEEDKKDVEEADIKIEDADKDEELSKKKKKKVVEVESEWSVLNPLKAIWTRTPEEVTHEEYASLYKQLTNDWEDHFAQKHFRVEGQLEFKSILFLPKRAPFDMFENKQKRNNIKFYVRRVFITDECGDDLCPEWLGFMKGIIDSEDLPLNISRECLQQNKILKVMKKNIVKKSLELFTELAEDKANYMKFYNNFSKNLKLGYHEDSVNRSKIVELLRFQSSKSKDDLISLREYVDRMKKEQKYIYYITGESVNAVINSPFLEKLCEKDYEVLFLVDAIDEYVTLQLAEYDGKKMMSCTKENIDLCESEEEKKKFEELKPTFEPLCNLVKETLHNKVDKVVIGQRMSRSPCILVTGEHGWTANMERIVKAQALRNPTLNCMSTKKNMELNPHNPIVKELKRRVDENACDGTMKDLIWLMFETALLVSGFALDDPPAYGKRTFMMISAGLSIEDTDISLDNIPEKIEAEVDELENSKMEHVD